MSVVVAPPAEPAPAGRGARLLAVLGLATAEGFSGLGVSLLIHGVVLLAAALYAVDASVGLPGLSLTAAVGEEAEEVSLDLIDTSFEPAGSAAATLQAPPLDPEPVLTADFARAVAAPAAEVPSAAAEGAGAGEAEGDADGLGQRTVLLPSGQAAIKAGSFTVWSVPADPRPKQNYVIVIRVDLPETLRLRKYPMRDLYGSVKGTDGYRQQLPHPDSRRRRGYLPIRNGQVELLVPVPGADKQLVRDRIKVGSRLLNESQELTLVF